tara:strand:+ start:112 stop:702 length:591 start_codon:yes stop_codon:yes gene_type:complete
MDKFILETDPNTLTKKEMEYEIDQVGIRVKKLYPNVSREQIEKYYWQIWKGTKTYANNKYHVFKQVGKVVDTDFIHHENLKGKGIMYLSIKTHDRSPCDDWREFQDIKNQLCGEECEGFQIYPRESELMDTANQFHMLVFPKGLRFGFGLREKRSVHNSGVEKAGGKQRALNSSADRKKDHIIKIIDNGIVKVLDI